MFRFFERSHDAQVQFTQLLDEGVTLLTASRRLAHHLRLAYAVYAQAQGRAAWRTPQVLPLGAWLRRAFLEQRATGGPSLQVLTASQARVLWEDIVASSRAGQTLLSPTSTARLAQNSWRRMHEYLIPLERLRAFDAPEPRALLEWCLEFKRRCADWRAIDETQLLAWAADHDIEPESPLAITGFDQPTPALQCLLDRWRSAGKLRELVDEAETGLAKKAPAVDAAAELELAARWARTEVERGADGVGVIVPDLARRREQAQRIFDDVFAPAARRSGAPAPRIPVIIAAPEPLADYPIVDAALLVLELAARTSGSTLVGRILRSPFIAGGESERAQRALSDLRLREEQRDEWTWFELERWAGITDCPTLHSAARSVAALVREPPNVLTAGAWSERFHRILRAAGWPGERNLSSVEHQTVQKFQAALAEFGALDAIAGRMEASRAVRRLINLLRDTPFEPETSVGAVMVIDDVTSAGMQFSALWITGMHAERIPAAVTPDPLIPLELQRASGLPEASAEGVRSIGERRVARWMRAAPKLVFSWPERDGDAILDASPLLAPLEQWTSTAPEVRPYRRLLFATRPALETLSDARAPQVISAEARGGARILELQSTCPFRAQAELRLGAQPMPRVTLGVEPLERGALLHRVLADVWGGMRTQRALLESDPAELAQRVREAAERCSMQALQPGAGYRARLAALEVRYAVAQVIRLLEVDMQRAPFAVRLAEAAERYAIGGLEITLRPDRIDELANGGELLIDYKLGEAHKPRDWLDLWPGRPRRPQLPLYALAHCERLTALAYGVLAPGAVEYRGWSRSAQSGAGVPPYPSGAKIDLGDPSDWDALLHRWRFTLTRLAEQFVSGEAAVDPLPTECVRCQLSTLCRVHERDLSERFAEEARDA